MASRNKKGKVHGIFKSAFQISFFHKPTMEGTDIYYCIVLEDLIFLSMRLLYDVVLVIDTVKPLSMTYLEPQYERLFTLLRDQTSVTVLISLIGNTTPFHAVCNKYDTPIVEKEEFINCPIQFYNKYKNYCRNDVGQYGFFLVAFKEDSFSAIDTSKPEEPVVEEPPTQLPVVTQPAPVPIPEPAPEPVTEVEVIPVWVADFVTFWEKVIGPTTGCTLTTLDHYVMTAPKDTEITLMYQGKDEVGIIVISKMSTIDKMSLVDLMASYGDYIKKNIHCYGVSDHDIIYNILEDSEDWKPVGAREFLYRCKK